MFESCRDLTQTVSDMCWRWPPSQACLSKKAANLCRLSFTNKTQVEPAKLASRHKASLTWLLGPCCIDWSRVNSELTPLKTIRGG